MMSSRTGHTCLHLKLSMLFMGTYQRPSNFRRYQSLSGRSAQWTKVDCLWHRRLRQGRKIRAAMRNISDYGCGRRKDGDSDEEGMDDWDQDKLDEVVRQKHGTEKNRPTDIICKFFLDAVEKKTYGW